MTAAFAGGALATGLWRSLRLLPQEAWTTLLPGALEPEPEAVPPPGEPTPLVAPPPLPPGWAPFGGARPEVRGWPLDSVLAVRGLAKQPPEVLRALLEVCERLGVPVDTVAAVVAHESRWDPAALYFRDKNDDGSPRKVPFVAAGICQLTVEAHLEGFGDWQRVREITRWPVERQLREVVLPLWGKYGGRVRGAHPGQGLMLNFLPDKAGGPEDKVLGEKGAKGFLGRVYAMNVGLDVNKDGKITIGDVYASAARVCRAAQGRRMRLDGSIWQPPPEGRLVVAPGSKVTEPTAAPSTEQAAAPNAPPEPAAAPTAQTEHALLPVRHAQPANAPAAASKPQAGPANAPAAVRLEPGTNAPPSSATGRSLRLCDIAGGLLLAAIREGREEAPIWTELLWEGRGKTAGVKLVLRVSAHAVRAPVEIEGLGTRLLRLPISYQEQIEVVRLRRWFPLTQTISDAVWTAAHRINPPLLGKWNTTAEAADSSRRMRTLEWVVQFNDQLDRQIPAESWHRLWATEGKDWIVHPRLAERADGKGAINYGLHRIDGTPWQSPGGKHDWTHFDHSQVLRAVEWEGTDPDTGKKVPVIEVLRKAGMPAAALAPFEGIT